MKKQIVKNILMNSISFVCNVVVGLLLMPYLVNHIGVAAYGLIPLAMFFTEYIGVITQSLTASINRSLTIEIQKNEQREANKVFNSALFLILSIVFFQFFFVYYPITNISSIISVPDELVTQAMYFFALVFLNFSISLISSIFSVSMYSKNRLDLMEVAGILRALIRVGIIVFLFNYGYVDLVSVGVASLISGFSVFLYSIYFWKKLTPQLSISPSCIDFKKLKTIFSLGGWLLLNQIGFLLFLKVDLLIVNKYLGAIASGEYSIAIKLSEVLRAFSGILSGVLGPVVMIYFAKQQLDKMVSMTVTFVKFLSLSMAIPIVVVCVYSEDILGFWMGDEFRELYLVVWVVTLPLFINLGVTPLFSINVAMNKVKTPALVTFFLGIIGVALSVVFIKFTDLGYFGVALSGVFILTIKNALFIPFYTAKILKLPLFTFSKIHINTMMFLFICLSVMLGVKSFFELKSLDSLLYSIVLSALLSLGCMLFFFSKIEIKELRKIVFSK